MKNVLITGASTGIGREIALHLDKRGWRVFAGVRKELDAERLRKDTSPELYTLMLDVTDPASIHAAIERVAEVVTESGLDALINNAGITMNGPMEFISMHDLRELFEVNFFGVVATTQAALPLIRKADRGRIVHIGSIGGRQAAPMLGPYAATKSAIAMIGEAQRRELQVWGIDVIVIEPGAIATPIWEKGLEAAAIRIERKSERELALYSPAFDALKAVTAQLERRALGPEAVAKVVEKALTAARPCPRYVVGTDAKIQALLTRFLPDRVRDAVILRFMRYPRGVTQSRTRRGEP
jgi:NAD(P)-dependent dehydrogenase (short-subunit alcohol dehydrogenase family)